MNREELWKAGKDETVEVNQRALIDKILARYSGENTIFRELLQNADDAGAQHVQVKFYSKPGLEAHDNGEGPSTLPDVKKDLIHRYVVTNDGIPFRPEDWARLKKIAEGNPDESKIGAFGVGFYSLWSCCDDPFVESGGKWMGFYWKDGKDQLMARSGDLPPSSTPTPVRPTLSGNPLTSFTMNLRDPSTLEGPLDLARFLITSLTFMRTIRKVDMLVDDVPVLEVEKSVRGKEKVGKRGMKDTSAGGMMKVKGVEETGMRINVKVMRWLSDSGFTPSALPAPLQNLVKPTKAFASFLSNSFFGRATPAPVATPPPPEPSTPVDPQEVTTLHREIQVYQAEIAVSVSSAFAKELERATKKAPPKIMPASLIFSQAEDGQAIVDEGSEKVGKDVGGVFSGLCPPLDGEKSAKVFIGQATSQTTGIGGHLAARFIPTVERESIDLVDKHVSHWNKELLWVGGYLSRLIYELESAKLQAEWQRTTVSDTVSRAKLSARALHALRFFTFNPTTPSSTVGQEMEMAFFQCSTDNKNFPLISKTGVLPIDQVRMPKPELEIFLPDLSTLSSETLQTASRSVARLRERGLLRDVTFDDVVKQLAARPLNDKEMIAALSWWQDVADEHGYTQQVRSRLIDAAVLITDSGKVVPLSMIQTIVRPQSSSIPTDMPLPPHTLSYNITKDLKGNSIFPTFGWTELTLLQYITFLVNPPMSSGNGVDPETDLRTSPAFAEKVLSMLGRAWQSVSANQQSAIALELKDVACIPTKAGFKRPGEAYFEKNLLFDDLPTIALTKAGPIKGGMEKMLLAIGVRKTVDLQLVFSRLVGGGTWTCQDLMKYLVSVKDTLTTDELAKLRQTAAFPQEVPVGADGPKPATVRKKPAQLYEPLDVLRDLGLPVLDWGEGKWKSNSDEARMLASLGLRKYPPVDVLLGIAAGAPPTNEKALNYLLAHTSTHYANFDPTAFAQVAFIPATKRDGKTFMAKPGEVFTNWDCAILGFAVADPTVASTENAGKLRLATDPPMEALISALVGNLTVDTDKARKIFEYLAGRMGTSGVGSLERLSNTPFIPVKTEKDVKVYRPTEVYFSGGTNSLYLSAFTFVDFGEKANSFLRYCGVRSEPSVKDVAKLLMREPEKMLRQAGSPDKYLEQLRLLAANWNNFDQSTKTAMKSAEFSLASQRVPVKRSSKAILGGGTNWEDEYERDWVLCRASDVAVVDDITFLQYFGKHVLAAPEEQLLETFYEHLGAKPLTSLINVEYIPHGPTPSPSQESTILRRHVLERLTIFLAEARRRQSDYTPESLAKEGGFLVQDVRQLEAKYTYKQGRQVYAHTETLYAMARRRGKGIVLTISMTAVPDDYDIASSLCSLLLKTPKADDALLLYSILTTPLMALKKRGFNVDRMLNLQREEKLRIQAEAIRDREASAAQTKSIEDAKASSMIPWPGSRSPTSKDTKADDTLSLTSDGSQSTGTAVASDTGGKMKLWDRLKNRRSSDAKKGSGLTMPGAMPGMPGMSDSASGSGNAMGGLGSAAAMGGMGGMAGMANMMSGMRGSGGAGGGGAGTSTKRPTDMNSIRNTVQKALDASRPETGTHIQDSRIGSTAVSESQSDYCDTTASADIVLALDPGSAALKLWIPRGVVDKQAFLGDKMGTCQRFAVEILMPIARVFNLANPVLNVFWDHEGPLIAFNRGGAVFCNARYFSAWHDNDCVAGRRNEAFISWYFSIAHELAHNLESAHNSAHEFYFSSIAEEYLVRFSSLLQTSPALQGSLI